MFTEPDQKIKINRLLHMTPDSYRDKKQIIHI